MVEVSNGRGQASDKQATSNNKHCYARRRLVCVSSGSVLPSEVGGAEKAEHCMEILRRRGNDNNTDNLD